MKYLKEFFSFINEEWSKNEPIKEIIRVDKGMAIFLIGAPGIGKSYFVKNHIDTKNPSFKDFSTDDVSLLYTKDPNVYYKGKTLPTGDRTKNASQLNLAKMMQYMQTGQNFIYDTTGSGKEFTDTGFEHIKEIYDAARTNGYKIIFIHLLSTLQTSIDQDKLRDRHVDPHYIKWAYAKQMGGMVDGVEVEGNMQRYKELGPDAYYIVTSIDKKYKFYKFVDGRLAKRRGGDYILKESIDSSSETDNIVECLLDMIDDGYNLLFVSPKGTMTYQQYLDEQGGFEPVFKPNDAIIRSQFTLNIYSNNKFQTYQDFTKITDEMISVIGRLKNYGWLFADFKVETYEGSFKDPKPVFRKIEYKFVKPDQKLDVERNFNLQNFKTSFTNTTGLNIEEIINADDHVFVEFSSNYYDGEIPSDLDKKFSDICDLYGFEVFDWSPGESSVSFNWEDD